MCRLKQTCTRTILRQNPFDRKRIFWSQDQWQPSVRLSCDCDSFVPEKIHPSPWSRHINPILAECPASRSCGRVKCTMHTCRTRYLYTPPPLAQTAEQQADGLRHWILAILNQTNLQRGNMSADRSYAQLSSLTIPGSSNVVRDDPMSIQQCGCIEETFAQACM